LLDKSIKPSSIVSYLDEFVIGQDEPKKILAVAVYSHYRKIEQARRDTVEIAKSNVLRDREESFRADRRNRL